MIGKYRLQICFTYFKIIIIELMDEIILSNSRARDILNYNFLLKNLE